MVNMVIMNTDDKASWLRAEISAHRRMLERVLQMDMQTESLEPAPATWQNPTETGTSTCKFQHRVPSNTSGSSSSLRHNGAYYWADYSPESALESAPYQHQEDYNEAKLTPSHVHVHARTIEVGAVPTTEVQTVVSASAPSQRSVSSQTDICVDLPHCTTDWPASEQAKVCDAQPQLGKAKGCSPDTPASSHNPPGPSQAEARAPHTITATVTANLPATPPKFGTQLGGNGFHTTCKVQTCRKTDPPNGYQTLGGSPSDLLQSVAEIPPCQALANCKGQLEPKAVCSPYSTLKGDIAALTATPSTLSVGGKIRVCSQAERSLVVGVAPPCWSQIGCSLVDRETTNNQVNQGHATPVWFDDPFMLGKLLLPRDHVAGPYKNMYQSSCCSPTPNMVEAGFVPLFAQYDGPLECVVPGWKGVTCVRVHAKGANLAPYQNLSLCHLFRGWHVVEETMSTGHVGLTFWNTQKWPTHKLTYLNTAKYVSALVPPQGAREQLQPHQEYCVAISYSAGLELDKLKFRRRGENLRVDASAVLFCDHYFQVNSLGKLLLHKVYPCVKWRDCCTTDVHHWDSLPCGSSD
eukprot:TRINITY_DN67672_c3_g2_i1.p1 TRINITY_DN67672_c3_g2~~TRINITY_DN67672_c3_g2_i1.p1  ORF type:complete len:604 (+),score=-1.21 TRINITY_DN67672_c3_g2_i1:79-1812(+)